MKKNVSPGGSGQARPAGRFMFYRVSCSKSIEWGNSTHPAEALREHLFSVGEDTSQLAPHHEALGQEQGGASDMPESSLPKGGLAFGGGRGIRTPGAFAQWFSRPPPSAARPSLREKMQSLPPRSGLTRRAGEFSPLMLARLEVLFKMVKPERRGVVEKPLAL